MHAYQWQKLLVFCCCVFLLYACSQSSHQHSISPAYRPQSEYAAEFVTQLKHSTLEVYPSILRMVGGTSFSVQSQQQIISRLNRSQITHAVSKDGSIDLGKLQYSPQWDIFVSDMHAITERLVNKESDAQYSLVMEFLFTPEPQALWGIHCYLFDRQRNNAFSFLLNSHHKLFVEAGFTSKLTSSLDSQLQRATDVALTALVDQLNAFDQVAAPNREGYSINTHQVSAMDSRISKILVIARIEDQLVNVFMHSFKHSLKSGFEANNIEAVVKLMRRDSDDFTQFQQAIKKLEPDALMYIDLDPLYRPRQDGHQAIVGTVFEVRLITQEDQTLLWRAEGKVDYILQRFSKKDGYSAHQGIRKEFAWHTTAAIVRAFMLDIYGHKSAPIYTDTEHRKLYQQRTD